MRPAKRISLHPPRVVRVLLVLEDGLLVLVLAAMILFSFTQIALRNLFDIGFAWIEPLLRHLVLWIALLGAMVAARENSHLSVDAVTAFLPRRLKMGVRVLTDAFTALVCGLLGYSSVLLAMDLYEYPPPGSFGDQAWIFSLVLPLGFCVMALRYLVFMVLHGISLITGNSLVPSETDEGHDQPELAPGDHL